MTSHWTIISNELTRTSSYPIQTALDPGSRNVVQEAQTFVKMTL